VPILFVGKKITQTMSAEGSIVNCFLLLETTLVVG
jgi:hypothetical protein